MAEYVQIHALVNYAASNPNRDRNNEPKRILIGNTERQRISSQCLKRTIRTSDLFMSAFGGSFGEGNLGIRTKELGSLVYDHLKTNGLDDGKADQWTRILACVFGVTKPEEKDTLEHHKSETMFFCTPEEKKALLSYCDRIIKEKLQPPNVKGKEPLEKEAAKIRKEILSAKSQAVDVHLFGRMFAGDKEFSVDAACQMAHAFTVNSVNVENDFFSTVDDLKSSREDSDGGSGHLGELGMGAGVFYLYATVNRTQLVAGVGEDLARQAIRNLVEAMLTVSPRGKSNSSAHQSRAFYGRVERGTKATRSLSHAYLKAVDEKDMGRVAIERLKDAAARIDKVYGKCYSKAAEFDALAGEGTLDGVLDLAGE